MREKVMKRVVKSSGRVLRDAGFCRGYKKNFASCENICTFALLIGSATDCYNSG